MNRNTTRFINCFSLWSSLIFSCEVWFVGSINECKRAFIISSGSDRFGFSLSGVGSDGDGDGEVAAEVAGRRLRRLPGCDTLPPPRLGLRPATVPWALYQTLHQWGSSRWTWPLVLQPMQRGNVSIPFVPNAKFPFRSFSYLEFCVSSVGRRRSLTCGSFRPCWLYIWSASSIRRCPAANWIRWFASPSMASTSLLLLSDRMRRAVFMTSLLSLYVVACFVYTKLYCLNTAFAESYGRNRRWTCMYISYDMHIICSKAHVQCSIRHMERTTSMDAGIYSTTRLRGRSSPSPFRHVRRMYCTTACGQTPVNKHWARHNYNKRVYYMILW